MSSEHSAAALGCYGIMTPIPAWKCFLCCRCAVRLRSGPTAVRIRLCPQLTRHLHSHRSAQLARRTGLLSAAPDGAGLSRSLDLRRSRCIFDGAQV